MFSVQDASSDVGEEKQSSQSSVLAAKQRHQHTDASGNTAYCTPNQSKKKKMIKFVTVYKSEEKGMLSCQKKSSVCIFLFKHLLYKLMEKCL